MAALSNVRLLTNVKCFFNMFSTIDQSKHGGSWSKSKFSESCSILVIRNGTGNLKVQSATSNKTNNIQQPIQSTSPINLAGRAARGELM